MVHAPLLSSAPLLSYQSVSSDPSQRGAERDGCGNARERRRRVALDPSFEAPVAVGPFISRIKDTS